MRLDRRMLGECRRLFTNAKNTAARLEKYNGLQAEPLYHPPRLAGRLKPGPHGDYVLSVGRLESVKRPDLAVQAMRFVDPPIRLLIVGDGTQRGHTERIAEKTGVADRVEFLGTVDDDRLIELYAGALAAVYAPYDEDFGYVTLEAFLARKPVITAEDSGRNARVRGGWRQRSGQPAGSDAIGAAINRLAADRARASSLAMPALSERARSPGMVWWRNSHSEQADHPDPVLE